MESFLRLLTGRTLPGTPPSKVRFRFGSPPTYAKGVPQAAPQHGWAPPPHCFVDRLSQLGGLQKAEFSEHLMGSQLWRKIYRTSVKGSKRRPLEAPFYRTPKTTPTSQNARSSAARFMVFDDSRRCSIRSALFARLVLLCRRNSGVLCTRGAVRLVGCSSPFMRLAPDTAHDALRLVQA